jgi:pyruvate dehydrogenase E2 component (dihydrolipoamide acetyltransferase)
MPFTLTMPKLSPTMAEGTIAKWHKKVGDFVDSGELLLEISTDKATVEYNALDAGWLKKILLKEGAKAIINEPLAIFTEQEKESIDGYKPEGVSPEAAPMAAPKAAPVSVAQPKPQVTKQAPAPQPKPVPIETKRAAVTTAPTAKAMPERSERIFASPLAKNIAKERGVNLGQVKGTGPHGRIMSRDLEMQNYQEQEVVEAQPATYNMPQAAAKTLPLQEEEIPLTPMRRVIAERLQYSKSTIPHFYVRQEIDVSALVALREEVKKFEKNFTINDFIIKAVALTLRKHPEVNSGFNPEKEALIRYPTVDISIAVTIQGGLITPILRNADRKSLAQVSQEIKQLASKAKDGKLKPEEFQGGSFTISNLGMFGVTDFQAIVNPPQAGILAIGTIQDKPVVKNGAVVPGKILSVTLSCDHRAIDGAEAAQFVKTLKELIENPILFLTE